MKINEFFDAVYCINMAGRPERRKESAAEFEKHGIQVSFVEAIDGKTLNLPPKNSSDGLPLRPGDIGCCLSHAKVAMLAKEAGFGNYCVFEDDIILKTDFTDLFSTFIRQVPGDWDLLYLGGSHNGGKKFVTENIVVGEKVFTTHAMGIRNTMYDSLIDVWQRKDEKIDIALDCLKSRFKFYAFDPWLAGQRPSWSDILDKFTDYKHLHV